MLIVEDWAQIPRIRKSEGVSMSELARAVGCSRSTVKTALASDGPPNYTRAGTGSLVNRFGVVGFRPRSRSQDQQRQNRHVRLNKFDQGIASDGR